MLKYLRTFFSPGTLIYSYNHPKDLIVEKVAEIVANKLTFLGSNDMTGHFLDRDTFAINLNSPAFTYGIKYRSILVGKIVETQKEKTEIRARAKPAWILYLLFFITIILGLVYLFKYFQTNYVNSLYWSLAMLLAGPVICIWFSNVANAAICERFEKYMNRQLKT